MCLFDFFGKDYFCVFLVENGVNNTNPVKTQTQIAKCFYLDAFTFHYLHSVGEGYAILIRPEGNWGFRDLSIFILTVRCKFQQYSHTRTVLFDWFSDPSTQQELTREKSDGIYHRKLFYSESWTVEKSVEVERYYQYLQYLSRRKR